MSKRNENRPGYKKTRVGWIPEEWRITPLKKVAKLERGRFSARPRNDPRYYGGTIPFVQTGDISSANLYIHTHSQTLNQAGLTVSKIFPKGTILMTIAANIGDVAISKYELACPDSLIGINGNQNVNQLWLFYYLSTQKRNFEAQAPQNAQKNINLEILGPHSIPLPPFPEQKKIAEILSAWDRAIEQVGRLIDAKQRLKKGLMQQLLTGRMRFPEFNHETHEKKKGKLPVGWRASKIGQVFKRVTRKNEAGVEHVLTASGEHGLIDQRDYFNRSVASKSLDGYYHLKKGEYAYNRSAMQGYPYGAIKRLNSYSEGVLSTLYLCFALSSQEHCSDFFMHYFEAGLLNRQLRGIVQVGARAHGLLNVTTADFFALQIPVPFFIEQEQIASVLNACDREIELLRRKEIALREQKKGLMQKLLTGEIRVKSEKLKVKS